MNGRVLYLDLIRITAIILVIACHLFGDTTGVSPMVISLLSYLEMPCNALFFAVSGALLLPVNSHPTECGKFLKKRLLKVVIPTFFWSVFYMCLSDTLSVSNCIAMLFKPQGSSILWFMYTLVGLYLLSPIISPFLQQADKKSIQLYLIIWSITLCYPILSNWIIPCTAPEGVGYYFTGYVGFYILGFYLRKFGIPTRLSAVAYFAFLFLMIAAKAFAPGIKLYDGFWYLTIFDAASVVFYWNVLKLIAEKYFSSEAWANRLAFLSNLVFGVYFTHIGIIKYVIPKMSFLAGLPYLLGYVISIGITFFGALALSYLISLLPMSNYIVGYKQKKKAAV